MSLVLVILIALFCLSVARGGPAGEVEGFIVSGEESAVIDLSTAPSDKNLVLDMQGFHVSGEGHAPLDKALGSSRWQRVSENPDILEKPRQYATLWLKARLENSSDEHVVRWLDLSPWRLNEVNAWLVEPESLDIREKMTTGLNIPIEKREVNSNKAIIPVTMPPRREPSTGGEDIF